MQCISPLTLRIPRQGITSVPCGKCNFCLQNKRIEWSFRLFQEAKVAKSSLFVTLTYDDDHVKTDERGTQVLCKRDVQLFLKRIRKAQAKIAGPKIRYYCVGEYGTETSRPHYHLLIFGIHHRVSQDLLKLWKQGHVSVGNVSDASIHYTTKYMVQRGQGPVRPFTLMSTKPAIGHSYIARMRAWHREDMRGYCMHNGFKLRMPRYYKDRIFTQAERSNRLLYKSRKLADDAFAKELVRLDKLHPEPFKHYEERVQHMHDKIKTKTKNATI